MSNVVKVIFLCSIFAVIVRMQINLDVDRTTNRYIKEALEFAVHDASLAIDKVQLGDGLIVFDTIQAQKQFLDTLRRNLKLDNSLHPNSNSFLTEPVKIVYFELIDDSTPGVTFPDYVYSNPTYQILDEIDGPAVVAVIETKGPRYFAGSPITIRRAAVYEYKQ